MAGFFKRLFGRRDRVVTGRQADADRLALSRLQWLLDAPLFVDEALVARLFDAVVRPEYDVQSRVVGTLNENARRRLSGGEIGGKAGFKLPFLGHTDAEAKAKHERERKMTTSSSMQVTERAVQTPGRQLEEIAIVYLDSHPDRIVFMDGNGAATTFDGKSLDLQQLEAAASDPPRMLAFVDLAPETTILPMACELQTGENVLLFLRYIDRLWADGEAKPAYPKPGLKDDELRTAWRSYWMALASRFQSRIAMEIVEQAAKESADAHGRIGWIDFRVPIGGEGDAMHLHVVPDGKYHTGTFAYNFVRRANNVGVRIVGTLRAGMGTDMNVLAIFDK